MQVAHERACMGMSAHLTMADADQWTIASTKVHYQWQWLEVDTGRIKLTGRSLEFGLCSDSYNVEVALAPPRGVRGFARMRGILC